MGKLMFLLVLVVTGMDQYLHGELIDKAPRFPCAFNQGSMVNCCTAMDLDNDGLVNDILFSCYINDDYPDVYYVYAEILRRNGTWCKKTWNKAFDDDGYYGWFHDEAREYPLLDAC